MRAEGQSVVISEIQTGSGESASQEFVELYNPTSQDIVVNDWELEYKSAASDNIAASWSTRALLAGSIKSHSYYLVAPNTYLPTSDAILSTGLASGGGHVRLVDADGTIIDLVGWGTANSSETTATKEPASGQSIERLPGRLVEDGGNAKDTQDNQADFILREISQPQDSRSTSEVPFEGPIPQDQPESDPELPPGEYPKIDITEALVDPAKPLMDTSDEFIELFNPGEVSVYLAGYSLRTGKDFHDHYVLPDIQIEPGQYLALYSNQTRLALTNSGGAVQLLDPAGEIISQTAEYPAAITGGSWAIVMSEWDWTIQTTPARPNILVSPIVLGASIENSPKPPSDTTKSAKKPKTAATPKPSKIKNPKVSASTAKTDKKLPPAKSLAEVASVASGWEGSGWLLIALGGLTIGYAIYEFRYDVRNKLKLAQAKLGGWRTAGKAITRRRGR